MLTTPWAFKLEIHSPRNFCYLEVSFNGLPAVGRGHRCCWCGDIPFFHFHREPKKSGQSRSKVIAPALAKPHVWVLRLS